MIQAAMKKGVKKFVFVTSLGCGSSKDSISEQVCNVVWSLQLRGWFCSKQEIITLSPRQSLDFALSQCSHIKH